MACEDGGKEERSDVGNVGILRSEKMTPREEVEAAIRIEMAWLRRAFEEISEGKLTWELKKYLSLSVAPWINSGVRMNIWIFEFSNEKIEVIDRRIAERLRADLPKKLMREFMKN